MSRSSKKHRPKHCEYCGTPLEKYFSVDTCAKLCDLSGEFFRKRIRMRDIGFVKIGGAVRIPASELWDLIKHVPSDQEEINLLLSK